MKRSNIAFWLMVIDAIGIVIKMAENKSTDVNKVCLAIFCATYLILRQMESKDDDI